MSCTIKSTITPKIGFASHQNSVPVLRELELLNTGEESLDHLVLELSADPPFLEPKNWRIDSLRAGTSLHITDRDVKLSAGFLAELMESVSGEVKIRIMRGDEELTAVVSPIEVLARNQWGGCGSMPELIAAFCMPNDPAVDRVLKGASDVLRRAGKLAGIDGYESKSRSRSWELASAIWSSVAGLGISYTLPPASFEQVGQKIRTPGAVLEGKVATCLDTTLLFAAALEQARLNPLLVFTKGHAFVGVWLQPQEFSQLITDEAAAVRKRVELQELLVFETTLVTNSPVPGFSVAVDQAKRQLIDEEFEMVVDIRRARMQRIRPLALAAAIRLEAAEDQSAPVSESLEEAPLLPACDVEIEPESTSPADKVALWQRKLLDLTTRNRLLHLPEKSKTVPLLCPAPEMLEDRLSDGKRVRIVAVPELEAGGRDAALYSQQNRENLHEQVAREALEKGEVLSLLTKSKLEAELIDLYRKARSDLDEGGANTLFLAIGILKWKKSADDPKAYRAPLILLPVKLERKSALSGVTMVAHEDEPRFNLTLLELLRQDFELTIPGLADGLPMDGTGVNVTVVLNTVRQAVRDIAGFEVVPDMVLGTFSFAKYLMWKDLADRKDQLLKSPVVRHLIERDGQSFGESREFPRPDELDRTIDPSGLFTPLPADSSQLAAVVASANGFNFVLDGPPGTGKSQTIANMIAHNLALGRRVLFVAEKMAALEVVHRRLQEKGLGEFCLEIHSNKTSKMEVLKQLERAWDTRDALSPEEWALEAGKVRRLRNRLNELVALLHKRQPNGLTLHKAIGQVVKDASDATPRLSWPAGTTHDSGGYHRLQDVARRLDLNLDATSELPASFGVISRSDWTNGWQEAIVATASDVPARVDALVAARDAVLTAVCLPLEAGEEEEMKTLAKFVRTLLRAHGVDLSFALAPDVNDRVAAARSFIGILNEYRNIESRGLSGRYASEACNRINLRQLDIAWSEAKNRFWFLATLACNQVAKDLAEQGGATGAPDPENDLPMLNRMHILSRDMDGLAPSLAGIPGWSKLASDKVKMSAALELGEGLRSAISAMAKSPGHLADLRSAIRKLVVDANELLGSDGNLASAVSRLESALSDFSDVSKRFHELCGAGPDATVDLAQLRETAAAIQEMRVRLKARCDWCRVRDEAIQLGLLPLIREIETGSLQKGKVALTFITAYARWFAADLIDAEPRLRNFVSAEHMSDIEDYRKMDDYLSELTVRYIRAKLCGLIPRKNDVSKRDGYGILKHELQKQRRHKPLRQLAIEMGDALTRLAPCMLMSPLSIAQYLPADLNLFDLVIFDEASQIAPWDAIGSIARGKQVVIAGDPRQMPPTSFFNRAATVTDDDVEEDMESILDECLGAGVPKHSLDWHYRSRHESLIAFSNHRYYESKLITFPAAVTRASAVTWRRVDGVYAKGKGRTNQAEAKAMVEETVKRLRDPQFIAAGLTLAIVTLNTEQQTLVENLLDQARQRYPEIEPFFSEDIPEPVVVKNLETVQGDERDLIMLGIGYGPTEQGANTMSMSFGPLNREGGWRRLNVAITRARREMLVFTSFDPSMVDLNRTSARAVRDLKHFVEYAHRGPQALVEAVNGSVGGYESPFEEAVAQELLQLGWQVVSQIGVSRFRIDLGIVHPDYPGDYLVGVECDGASYHSAATARDRDKVRAAVLDGLGWRLVRVWSTEWWVDKHGALQKLNAQIESLLEDSRAKADDNKASAQFIDQSEVDPEVMSEVGADLSQETGDRITSLPARSSVGTYTVTDLSTLSVTIDASRFYDSSYDADLRVIIGHVLESEAPINDVLLVQRIARAHGFLRTGRVIHERVRGIVDCHYHAQVDPVGGAFVWRSKDEPLQWSQYRVPASEDDSRKIEEIAFEELRAAILTKPSGDVPIEVARIFGVRRLAFQGRERLEAAVRECGTSLDDQQS